MKGCQLVILRFLLTKADFFVDGKDLQTFVSATLRSRFFLPAYCSYQRLRRPGGDACACSSGSGMAGCAQSSIT